MLPTLVWPFASMEQNAGLKKQVEDFMKEKEAAVEETPAEECTRLTALKSLSSAPRDARRSSEEHRFPTFVVKFRHLFFVAGNK